VVARLDKPENMAKKIDNRVMLMNFGYNLAFSMDKNSRFRELYAKMVTETLYQMIIMVLVSDKKSNYEALKNGVSQRMVCDLIKYCKIRSRIFISLFFNGYYKLAERIIKLKK
jgi:hypothetical protein